MPGRKPISEYELPAVYRVLRRFPARDQALLTLGLHTGFRITELLSLDVRDVWEGDGLKHQVRVARRKMKGGRSTRRSGVTSRSVWLNEAATSILRSYLFTRFGSGPVDLDAPLFPSRIHGQRLKRWRANAIVHDVLTAAGLADQELYGTHTLRKTFCRQIYLSTNHDINLTRAVMGHTSVVTTQRYLHVDDGDIQNAVLRIGRSAPATVGGVSSSGQVAAVA